jgi:hypothetical protein
LEGAADLKNYHEIAQHLEEEETPPAIREIRY